MRNEDYRIIRRRERLVVAVLAAWCGLILFLAGNVKSPVRLPLVRRLDDEPMEGRPLPSYTDGFVSINSDNDDNPSSPGSDDHHQQLVFWYISKAGGSTLATIFSECLRVNICTAKLGTGGKIISSNSIKTIVGAGAETRRVLNTCSLGNNNTRFTVATAAPLTTYGSEKGSTEVNSSLDASSDIVTPTEVARVVFTPNLFEAAKQAASRKGKKIRVFAMFRHPAKRAIEQFYYRQTATWEPSFDPVLATMSLYQYAMSTKMVDNYMVRSLNAHKFRSSWHSQNSDDSSTTPKAVIVTRQHVETAKAILRSKMIVGIYEWYDVSVVQFEKYYGWYDTHKVMADAAMNQCHYNAVQRGKTALLPSDIVESRGGDEAYSIILRRNWADLELYRFAKRLFKEQSKMIWPDETQQR